MTTIKEISSFLDAYAPTRLAAEWDNVGLLVGDAEQRVRRVMTCLTVTAASAAEAIERSADLIVSHHPLPFRPFKRLTTDSTPSRLLWDLIRAGISIYSPHTGFDSAAEGINQSLAKRLDLHDVTPLIPIEDDLDGLGAGRLGSWQGKNLAELISHIKQEFQLEIVQFVGDREAPVSKVAIACGSGGSYLSAACRAGCDTFLTGETTFHSCLEANASNVSLVLIGHYTSERFAIEYLADRIQKTFTEIEVWASQKESDPTSWL